MDESETTSSGGAQTDGDAYLDESGMVFRSFQWSPIRRWVLLDGDRATLIYCLTGLVFAVAVGLGYAAVIPATDPDAVVPFIGALVGGTLPFITIVLAINQLVLSQELDWPGALRDRFREMTAFRRDVEDLTGAAVSPASPADFLQLLVDETVDRAEAVLETVSDADNDRLQADVDRYVSDIRTEGDTVTEALSDAEFGTFEALSTVLNHYNGEHLHTTRVIRQTHADEVGDATALDELVDLLEQLAVARQTFKTLYMQYELAFLSRLLLYVGFPSLLGGGLLMMSYGTVVATLPASEFAVLVMALGVTLVFLPFIVLLAYTLRIATVASRTADFGPFVPQADIQRTE
ncbi:hypothetical protein ACNS7O_08300 [Haloferacaceae archaeon DSL9]